MQNAPREHSAILSAFIKLPFVMKVFALSIFEWPLKIGLTAISHIYCSDPRLRVTGTGLNRLSLTVGIEIMNF